MGNSLSLFRELALREKKGVEGRKRRRDEVGNG